jgi:hypothetical protein
MNAGDAPKLAKLLKKLRLRFANALSPAPDASPDHARGRSGAPTPMPAILACPLCPKGEDPVVAHAVYATLLWESSSPFAADAMRRVLTLVADFNELRVASAEDIADSLGPDDARALERGMRLRSMLSDISAFTPSLRVSPLRERPRRDAKSFLQSLHAAPTFVLSRLALVEFGTHALPVDQRLRALLVDAKVLHPSTDLTHAAHWLEREIPAADAVATASLLQAWSDADGAPPPLAEIAPIAAHSAPRVAKRAAKGDAAGERPPRGEKRATREPQGSPRVHAPARKGAKPRASRSTKPPEA